MKQGLTLPVREPGESEEAFHERVIAWAQDGTVRSKADSRELIELALVVSRMEAAKINREGK